LHICPQVAGRRAVHRKSARDPNGGPDALAGAAADRVEVTYPNHVGSRAMLRLLYFIDLVLNLYVFLLIAAALLSWLVAFNVVNTRNPVVAMLGEFLYRITEPVLRPIRNMLPNFGGIDISPIVAILAIYFIQIVIIGNLREAFI
jgi:YggT family protein